jgi:purine-binding chemotaxis protein CheW
MKSESERQEELTFLGFFLDKWEYGLPIEIVREIIRMVEITPIPETPTFLAGVIDLRGEIVSIVDLRRRLGLAPKEYSLSTPIIISDISGHTTGIIVDQVSEVLTATKSQICQPSFEVPLPEDLLKGVLRLDGQLLLLLDLEKILTFEAEKILEKATKVLRAKKAQKGKQSGKRAG